MAPQSETDRDLEQLATELRRLEGEYNMFFGGRAARPPHETRSRVEALLKRLDRRGLDSVAQRFRLQTLQSRYSTFVELWERGMRAREMGRPGPFAPPRPARAPAAPAEAGAAPADRTLHVESFRSPRDEIDRLETLYVALMDARREAGERVVPFHKFAELVKDEVLALRRDGADEVALRVAIRDGRVRLLARPKTAGP